MAKLDPLLDEIVKRGGSDLHVAGGAPPLGRVGGDLVALRDGALDARAAEEMLLEILSPAQRARLEQDRELEVGYAHGDVARFRGSYFHKAGGLGAVFRVVRARTPSLAELGCPEILWKLADRSAGLVLVVGPARSGKSTTISAMVDHINKTRACHVLTIEEPIELVYEPLRAQITQREVGPHAPSVEAALRNASRENPDVVIAGELRTAAATAEAVRLAASGVLVLASVRAAGVAAALERLVSAFGQDEQPQARARVAEALAGAVAQLLVRAADGARAPVHEVLVSSPAAVAAIREGRTADLVSIMQTGQAQGMLPMDVALARLVEAKRLAADVALDHALDKQAFAPIVLRARPDLAERLASP